MMSSLSGAGVYARMWNSQGQLSAYAYAEGDAEDAGAVGAVDGSTACTDRASTVPARLPLPRRLTPAAPVTRRRPSCGA